MPHLQSAPLRNVEDAKRGASPSTTLHPANVIAELDELTSIIEPDIPLEMARWDNACGGSVAEWKASAFTARR